MATRWSEDGRAASTGAERGETRPYRRIRAGGELHGQFEVLHFSLSFSAYSCSCSWYQFLNKYMKMIYIVSFGG